jgi:hypothetical protein
MYKTNELIGPSLRTLWRNAKFRGAIHGLLINAMAQCTAKLKRNRGAMHDSLGFGIIVPASLYHHNFS